MSTVEPELYVFSWGFGPCMTTDLDGPSSGEVYANYISANPCENALKDDGQVNSLTIKRVPTTSLMHHILTVFLVTQSLSCKGSSKRERTRQRRHTPSFLLGRLVSESPRSWNSSLISWTATILIITTSISSTIPTSKIVLTTRVRPTLLTFTNLGATTI